MRKLTPDDIKLATKERPLNSLEKDQVLANLDKIKADKTLSRSQKKQAERTANAMISSGGNAYINNDKVEFENSLGEKVKSNDLHWLDKVAQVITGNEKDTNKYKSALSKGIVDSSAIKAPIVKATNSVREYANKNQQTPVALSTTFIPNTRDMWADFDYQDPIVAPVTTKKNTTKGKTAAQIKLEQEAAAKKAKEDAVKKAEEEAAKKEKVVADTPLSTTNVEQLTSVTNPGTNLKNPDALDPYFLADTAISSILNGTDNDYPDLYYKKALLYTKDKKEKLEAEREKISKMLNPGEGKSRSNLNLEPDLVLKAHAKIKTYTDAINDMVSKERIIANKRSNKANNIKLKEQKEQSEKNNNALKELIKKDGGIIKLQLGKFFLPQSVIDKQRVYNSYKKSQINPEEIVNPLSFVQQAYYRSKNNVQPEFFRKPTDANGLPMINYVNNELSRIRQPLTTNTSITNPLNIGDAQDIRSYPFSAVKQTADGKPVLSGVNYNNNGVATVGNPQQGSERDPMTGLTRKDNFKINVNKTPISGIQALSAAFPALSMLFSKPTTAYQKYAENYVAPAKGLSQDQQNLTRNQFAANSALGRLNAASTDFRDRVNANAVFNSQQSQMNQNLAVEDAQQFNQAKLAEVQGVNLNNKERNNFTNEMSRVAAEQKNIRNQTIMDSIGKTIGNFGQLYADQANDLNQRKQGATQLEAQNAQFAFQGNQQGLMQNIQNHYNILNPSKVIKKDNLWVDPMTGKPFDNQDYYNQTELNLRKLEDENRDSYSVYNNERRIAAQKAINPERTGGFIPWFTGVKGNTYKKGGTLNVEERKDLETHKDKLKNAKLLDEKILKMALEIAKENNNRNEKVSNRNFEKLKLLISKK